MSNKNWFSVFSPASSSEQDEANYKWQVVGISCDNGDEVPPQELFIGPLKTKRAADYASRLGWDILSFSIKEIEQMAKKSETEKAKPSASSEPIAILPYKIPSWKELISPLRLAGIGTINLAAEVRKMLD